MEFTNKEGKKISFADNFTIDGQQDTIGIGPKLIALYQNIIEADYNVYSIVGNWETGKSFIAKSFEKMLLKNNYPVLYIDAYSNDYKTDPFSMLIKSVYSLIDKLSIEIPEETKKKVADTTKNILTCLAKSTGKIGLHILLSKLLPEAEQKEILDELKAGLGKVVDDFSLKENEEDKIYNDFISATKEMVQALGNVTIIVDELDRCRPDFSLELLEKIKHIFNIPKLKFVLIYNTNVMTGIIKQKYGLDIDEARKYVKKFVDKQIELGIPSHIYEYLNNTLDKLKKKGLDNSIYIMLSSRLENITNLCSFFELSFREIERIFSNIDNVFNRPNRFGSHPKPEIQLIAGALEFMKEIFPIEYNEIKYQINKTTNADVLLNSQLKKFKKVLSYFDKDKFTDTNSVIMYITSYFKDYHY